ncbi:hypothetical protein J3E68DRAFT_434881 [Trichoderma sp. SZMC 28012]
MPASPLPHKARCSKNHNTPGGLQSTATVLLLRLRATLHCPATAVVVPVGSLRWPGSFGGAGQTDSDATRKHWGAWHGSREKGTGQQNNLDTCTARSAPAHPYRERVQSTSGSTSSCHPFGTRERKRSSATEWLPSGSRPHTPELLNTLTCHGQPPADLAIWGSSQLLLALPSILARPLALLSDGRDACGLQPQRPIWPRSPETRQEGGKQKRSQRHGRLARQGQNPHEIGSKSSWPR